MKNYIYFILLAVLITSCGSGVSVTSDYDKTADFYYSAHLLKTVYYKICMSYKLLHIVLYWVMYICIHIYYTYMIAIGHTISQTKQAMVQAICNARYLRTYACSLYLLGCMIRVCCWKYEFLQETACVKCNNI